MAQLITNSLLEESLSLVSKGTGRSSLWTVSEKAYYDLTPPSEVSDTERPVLLVPPCAIDSKIEPLVAVIGVGYVGEHLVSVFSEHFDVLGYDVSDTRTAQLSRTFKDSPRIRLTSTSSDLAEATHFLISVPTLLLPDKTIDSSFLRNALATVGLHARAGSVIVVESSVAVGMTRQLLGPLAKEKGYFAGMSPERVDPGRVYPAARAIPKIISGLDDIAPGSLNAIHRLYSKAFEQVVPVSRPEVAEMVKLYENCQRMLCIAYANEMADACESHGISPFEVCNAAATKPFGYMPYLPGVGVGGHCIPVNPYYLLSNNSFPLLEAASEAMSSRPASIAHRAIQRIQSKTGGYREGSLPRILVVGMGFKSGQSHLANSPGLALAKSLLLTQKVDVAWADPLVARESIPQIPRFGEQDWEAERLEQEFDMIIVVFRQLGLDFQVLDRVEDIVVEFWCS